MGWALSTRNILCDVLFVLYESCPNPNVIRVITVGPVKNFTYERTFPTLGKGGDLTDTCVMLEAYEF